MHIREVPHIRNIPSRSMFLLGNRQAGVIGYVVYLCFILSHHEGQEPINNASVIWNSLSSGYKLIFFHIYFFKACPLFVIKLKEHYQLFHLEFPKALPILAMILDRSTSAMALARLSSSTTAALCLMYSCCICSYDRGSKPELGMSAASRICFNREAGDPMGANFPLPDLGSDEAADVSLDPWSLEGKGPEEPRLGLGMDWNKELSEVLTLGILFPPDDFFLPRPPPTDRDGELPSEGAL